MLGRTELISETSNWVNDDEEQLNERKLKLREKLIEENGTVTMVQWENAWKPFARSLDIFIQLMRLNQQEIMLSISVAMYQNLKNLTKVGKTIGQKFGPITGIIHGAGIEDSKLIGDKNPEIFEKVVSIKTDGWINLVNASEVSGTKHLRFACCFTSIAGRFGNAGQTDYSAANCILDAEMSRLNALEILGL